MKSADVLQGLDVPGKVMYSCVLSVSHHYAVHLRLKNDKCHQHRNRHSHFKTGGKK
jgi:hypothetical protein